MTIDDVTDVKFCPCFKPLSYRIVYSLFKNTFSITYNVEREVDLWNANL